MNEQELAARVEPMGDGNDSPTASNISPLPWHVEEAEDVGGVAFANGASSLDFDGWFRIEDARHIVRCVNTHDDLISALKAMVASYDGLRESLTSAVVLRKLAAADAAIAKAEGGH